MGELHKFNYIYYIFQRADASQHKNNTPNQTEVFYTDEGLSWCRFNGADYSESGFHVAFFGTLPMSSLKFVYFQNMTAVCVHFLENDSCFFTFF